MARWKSETVTAGKAHLFQPIKDMVTKRRVDARGGFALVAVMLMITLMTFVLVALLSMLRLESRAGGDTLLRNQARQNALLALDVALGEVQENLGPDRRISAPAAFLDSDPNTLTIDTVEQPNWVGAWESASWNPLDNPGTTLPNYAQKQQSKASGGKFLRWLVSTPPTAVPTPSVPNPTNLADSPVYPKTPGMTPANSVVLVGPGTVVAKNPSVDNVLVRAPLVSSDVDNAGHYNSYAWWVGDEGTKAKITGAAPTNQTGALTLKNSIDLENALASSPRSAMEVVSNYYKNLTVSSASEYSKLLTFFTLPLIFKESTTKAGDFTKSYFDFTTYSQGVLADVQNGGLKRDLNLLMELDKDKLPTFVKAAGATGAYEKIYSRKDPKTSVLMGPSWGYVYRYYNLYKSPYLEKDSNGVFTFAMDPYNTEIADIDTTSAASQKLPAKNGERDFILPQTLRMQYLFGFFKAPPRQYEKQYWMAKPGSPPGPNQLFIRDPAKTIPTTDVLYLAGYPTVHLWNPYNILLRSTTSGEMSGSPAKVSVPAGAGGGPVKPTAHIWSFPNPPLNIQFSGQPVRSFLYNGPLLPGETQATKSIFQPNGGSMCSNWIMHGTFYQIVMLPGTVRVFGIENNPEQGMYWQEQVDDATKPETKGGSPDRAFSLIDGWNTSSPPLHSNYLTDTGDYHIPATGPVQFTLSWNMASLDKAALGYSLFYENNPIQRMPGIFEINTKQLAGTVPPVDPVIYKDLIMPGDLKPIAIAPSQTGPSAIYPEMSFSYNINVKVYPKDAKWKSKAMLFSDPTEKSYAIMGGDAKALQMAPIEMTVTPIQGSANGSITNFLDGSPAVQVTGASGSPLVSKNGYFGALSDGVNSNIVTDFPLTPMTSMAQLQNVALGRDYTHPIYQTDSWLSGLSGLPGSPKMEPQGATFFHAMGNSYAHPAIPASAVIASSGRSFDHSFYSNNAFWDSYYLSGITPQESVAFNTTLTTLTKPNNVAAAVAVTNTAPNNVRSVGKVLADFLSIDPAVQKSLPVARLIPWVPEGKTTQQLGLDILSSYDEASPNSATINVNSFARSAAWLMVDGAFNVNSASVDAWAALLGGNYTRQVPKTGFVIGTGFGGAQTITTSLNRIDSPLLIPFLRMGLSNNDPAAATSPVPQTLWNGYRTLTAAQIQALAVEMVRQVKLRGPFLSLAEFVNRQISTDVRVNQAGALQTAVDETGLNNDAALASPAVDTSEVAAGYDNPPAAKGPMSAGSNGFLTQADLLKPIAGVISARSDTFTIRTYGEVTKLLADGVTKVVLSRAWCEAVVQRTPEYVDQSDPMLATTDPIVGPNPGNATPPSAFELTSTTAKPLSETNFRLGRRFRIIQFRWLNSDEV